MVYFFCIRGSLVVGAMIDVFWRVIDLYFWAFFSVPGLIFVITFEFGFCDLWGMMA